ncbi:unnamed protein product [Mytilus edulis]|uniref:Uncharacterized protein n=1 Tax=Mytilus edulis TaxID=6550 RepID=A0A8S3QLT1_MYTED|nr:unnamed protein product [Mytilus edulis]
MDNCIFCDKVLENGEQTVKLGKKGCDNINKISSDRQQDITTVPGLTVHHDCRRDFIYLKSTRWKIVVDVDAETSTPERGLRSSKPIFKFKDNCLFCGQTAKNYKRKRGYDVVCVKTLEFQSSVESSCRERNDKWVLSRIQMDQQANAKTPEDNLKKRKISYAGRPKNDIAESGFQAIMLRIEKNQKQISIADIVREMEKLCGLDNTYSVVHMKKKIQNYFAQLIKEDIKLVTSKDIYYPSADELESETSNADYVPRSLRIFLNSLFSEADCVTKISAIGHAIIQATRPRSVIAPLQIGLGIQMHHHFSSRFLIDTLYNLGFCSSYSEVQKFEMNAAASRSTENENENQSFVQYIADNVDHNIRSLDGFGTFHGMGIIAASTPGIKTARSVPRANPTTVLEGNDDSSKRTYYQLIEVSSEENSMQRNFCQTYDTSEVQISLTHATQEEMSHAKANLGLDLFLKGDVCLDDINQSNSLDTIKEKIEQFRQSRSKYKTANLWFHYMDMVCILRDFILGRENRTGNWTLHLESLVPNGHATILFIKSGNSIGL